MNSNKKNAVIVGYGGMGGWHAKYFTEKNSDCVNLLGIWDIKEERRQAAAEKGIYAYSSLEEVLADERVDFITIATPNDVHKEIAVAAMAARWQALGVYVEDWLDLCGHKTTSFV